MIAVVSWSTRARWTVGPVAGLALGSIDSAVNHVPGLLGEVGTARAERGGWSQAAEFCSLILDAERAWAAAAVVAGWLVSRHARPASGCRAALRQVVAALVVPAGAALQMALLPPPPDSRMAQPVRCTV